MRNTQLKLLDDLRDGRLYRIARAKADDAEVLARMGYVETLSGPLRARITDAGYNALAAYFDRAHAAEGAMSRFSAYVGTTATCAYCREPFVRSRLGHMLCSDQCRTAYRVMLRTPAALRRAA